MNNDLVLNGINCAADGTDPQILMDMITKRCIDRGLNFAKIYPKGNVDQSHYLVWAKFLTEHQLYFCYSYLTYAAADGFASRMLPETAAEVKRIAGEYFLGECFGEPGSAYACKLPGYYMISQKDFKPDGTRITDPDPTQYRGKNTTLYRYGDMAQAHKGYVDYLSRMYEAPRKNEMPNIMCIEATAFSRYNVEAGVTFPLLEICPGNPEILTSNVRGTARGLDTKQWGVYVAHGWYGGMRHTDTLKKKRLELTYKYAYMAGSQLFILENGDVTFGSYGMRMEEDSDICRNYRDVLQKVNTFMKEDARPKGGPKVKVAFVSGLHDGWAGKWGRSCLWNQFYKEEWGYNEAEHSWRMLEELHARRYWGDPANYGQQDTSGAPGYGLYDIVPIEADVEKLSQYDWLIFLGWNSMTEENMDKLTEYVRRGGHLIMSAAHLNTQTKRDGEFQFVSDEKIRTLFGCFYMGEIRRTIDGAKFKRESLDSRVLYPVYNSGGSDPMYTAGYADYARFATIEGQTIAYASDQFSEKLTDLPMVIENKIGDGVATLVTHVCYPGNQAVYQVYNTVVRENLTASARSCDVQVVGSDRVRYSVYEGGKMYLLNTDYDMPIIVKVRCGDWEEILTLEPLELRALQLPGVLMGK